MAVPRADGYSLHEYDPSMNRFSCAICVIVFVRLICLRVLFLTLYQVYVDAAMLYPLFHRIYSLIVTDLI